MDDILQPMGETVLSGAEEDLGEAGDDLLDLGGMIGNKVAFLPTLHHLTDLSPYYIAICPSLS